MPDFTPEEDCKHIWGQAYLAGCSKYDAGQKEHRTAFQTAGASWYADQIRDEVLDSVAYTHHLRDRLASIRSLASMMKEDDSMTIGMAATILEYLAGDHPPRAHVRRHLRD